MAFTNLLVLSTLLYVVSSAHGKSEKAYLFVNGSLPTKDCYFLPTNKQCPSSLVSYKVFGFSFGDVWTNTTLKSVELIMKWLDSFQEVTQDCRDAVREYTCSNSFARCVKDNTQRFGFALTFNVTRTEQACARVKKVCPVPAQLAIVHNCTTITKDIQEYSYCVDIPYIHGDLCPKSPYKHPKVNADLYPTNVRNFNASFATFAPFLNLFPSCNTKKFFDVNCELFRGAICSKDMMLRMYTTTQQQCIATIKNCIPNFILTLHPYFLEMCALFPDGNTAKMVTLPHVSASNVNDDK